LSRPAPIPDPARGQVFGCFVVVRESYPQHGTRFLYVRALCCQREKRVDIRVLVRSINTSCTHCRGRKARAA